MLCDWDSTMLLYSIVFNSNNNNSSLILAFKDISSHTRWLLWYPTITQEKLLVPLTVCQEDEGNALSQQIKLGATLPTLTQGHTNRDSFSVLLPSTHTPWASWGMQPVLQLIPPCIPLSKILVMSAAANILRSVEMNRKWCIDLLDAFN